MVSKGAVTRTIYAVFSMLKCAAVHDLTWVFAPAALHFTIAGYLASVQCVSQCMILCHASSVITNEYSETVSSSRCCAKAIKRTRFLLSVSHACVTAASVPHPASVLLAHQDMLLRICAETATAHVLYHLVREPFREARTF